MNPLLAIPGVAQAKAAFVAGKVWFYVGAAVLLFLLGAYCGHRWEASATAEQKVETTKAESARDAWRASSDSWEKAANAWSARYKADEAQRAEYARQAGKTLEELARLEAAAHRQQAEWQRKFEAAKASPDCLELLKDSKCAAFRSY